MNLVKLKPNISNIESCPLKVVSHAFFQKLNLKPWLRPWLIYSEDLEKFIRVLGVEEEVKEETRLLIPARHLEDSEEVIRELGVDQEVEEETRLG